jgi:hypothetical protein
MGNVRHSRLVVVGVLGVIALGIAVAAPAFIEASPQHEYKFVRLVDEGAMPVITEALNREAERGWELKEMAVAPGEPHAIYLVFWK